MPVFIRSSALLVLVLFAISMPTQLEGASSGKQRTILKAEHVDLPTYSSYYRLIVEARINNAGPFRLLVDTCASELLLSEKTANAAKIDYKGSAIKVHGVYGQVACRPGQIDLLESGGLRLENTRVWVFADQDFILDEIDGVLGIEPLRDVILEMDFPAKQVSVGNGNRKDYANSPAVAFTLDDGHVTIEMELAGTKQKIALDTGSSNALNLPNFNGLPLLYDSVKQTGPSGGLGPFRALEQRSQLAGDVRIGPLVLRNPPIQTCMQTILGTELMQRMKFALDQRRKRIYFLDTPHLIAWEKETPKAAQTAFGLFFTERNNALNILEVTANSAWDISGVMGTDRLIAINGQPPMMSERFVSAMKSGRLTEPLTIKLQRGKDNKELTLTLVNGLDTPEEIKAVITNYDRINEISPGHAIVFFRRAIAKQAFKDYQGARADFIATAGCSDASESFKSTTLKRAEEIPALATAKSKEP